MSSAPRNTMESAISYLGARRAPNLAMDRDSLDRLRQQRPQERFEVDDLISLQLQPKQDGVDPVFVWCSRSAAQDFVSAWQARSMLLGLDAERQYIRYEMRSFIDTVWPDDLASGDSIFQDLFTPEALRKLRTEISARAVLETAMLDVCEAINSWVWSCGGDAKSPQQRSNFIDATAKSRGKQFQEHVKAITSPVVRKFISELAKENHLRGLYSPDQAAYDAVHKTQTLVIATTDSPHIPIAAATRYNMERIFPLQTSVQGLLTAQARSEEFKETMITEKRRMNRKIDELDASLAQQKAAIKSISERLGSIEQHVKKLRVLQPYHVNAESSAPEECKKKNCGTSGDFVVLHDLNGDSGLLRTEQLGMRVDTLEDNMKGLEDQVKELQISSLPMFPTSRIRRRSQVGDHVDVKGPLHNFNPATIDEAENKDQEFDDTLLTGLDER